MTAYDYPGWIRAEAVASGGDGHDVTADHIAFWFGGGRIPPAGGVVEEEEPEDLRAHRRRFVRL